MGFECLEVRNGAPEICACGLKACALNEHVAQYSLSVMELQVKLIY